MVNVPEYARPLAALEPQFEFFVGIDSDGALRLQRDDNQVERILAGDVKLLS